MCWSVINGHYVFGESYWGNGDGPFPCLKCGRDLNNPGPVPESLKRPARKQKRQSRSDSTGYNRLESSDYIARLNREDSDPYWYG
ncbi:hypothetical protein J2S59_000854 [Nocardioides massiliensis]|uniref:Uncharacterized protein n=1 Tax=Nocardioides massiliensis TaxID=1325935 RepID=A0ABT9NMI9_9ACTN|nr:hypothetical protein [Nocardioides massiliensis]